MSPNKLVPCLKETELIEGLIKRVQVSGRTILLIRKENQVFAISNICPHMGCSLEKGILRDHLLMCPCHGWKFDIRNGQYEENKAISIASYQTKIQNGKIHIEMPDKSQI